MPSRKYQESREEIEKILREEIVGYLGLSLAGKSYVVPLNYGYVEGSILIHCALTGKKLDYLIANPQVCFTVGRQAGRFCRHPQGASCPTDTDGAVCYGTARIVENLEERRKVLNTFNRCLQPEAPEIAIEAASRCCAVEIRITEMTGRRQRGLEYSYWRWRFAQDA